MEVEGQMNERTFTDAHGVEVFSRWWAIDDPFGVVLISHGAAEHSGRYDRFARALNAAGFAAVGLDHRGHGRTRAGGPGPAVMGPGGGEAVIDDLHAVRTQAKDAFGPTVPVHLFGHSMGSLIALAYLTRHADGVASAVLCGFPVGMDDAPNLAPLLQGIDPSLRDQPVGELLGDNNAPFEPARTPSDWLTRDTAEVDRFIADPLSGDANPLTFGYLADLFDVVAPARDHLAAISCPVLVIAGDQDPAAAMGAHATSLAQALRVHGVAVDVALYEGARHELLNETNRDVVTTDIIEFLRR